MNSGSVADPATRRATAVRATAAGPPGAIDVHHHVVTPSLRAALRRRAEHDLAFARRYSSVLSLFAAQLDDVDGRLEAMNAAGIEAAVLSAPPPAASTVESVEQPRLAQQVNEELLQIAGRCPGRFLVALCLPESPEDAATECARLSGEADVRAVVVLTGLDGLVLDDARFDALWSSCDEARLVVLLHPALAPISPALAPWQLTSGLGAPFETTVAATRLVLSGVLDRHPGLDVVVPHLGGVGPYLLGRLEDQSSPGDAALPFCEYWRRRLFLDTCSFHPPALSCARASVGADRLVLGSDYPFRGSLVRAVGELADLAAGEREAIARTTALQWFAPATT